jgi:hypothetical protein
MGTRRSYEAPRPDGVREHVRVLSALRSAALFTALQASPAGNVTQGADPDAR